MTLETTKLLKQDPEGLPLKNDADEPMRRLKNIVILIGALIFLGVTIGFGYVSAKWFDPSLSACNDPDLIETSASLLSMMDQSVDPCIDFYEYSCGRYIKEVVPPAGASKWGSFQRVAAKTQETMKKALETPGSEYKGVDNSAIEKTKNYYKACMNTTGIEEVGTTPMLELIRSLGSWTLTSDSTSGVWKKDTFNLEDVLAKSSLLNVDALFAMSISADDKNSDVNIIKIGQAKLGLPAVEYYTDDKKERERKAYMTFIANVATLLGADEEAANKRSIEIYEFEAQLAKIFIDKQILDAETLYNKMTIAELSALMPSINFKSYLDNVFGVGKVANNEDVIVESPDYIIKLSQLVNNTDTSLLADYVVWHTIQKMVNYLSHDFVQVYLDYSKTVDGLSDLPPRWQTCFSRTEAALGFAVGALFVEKHFSPQSKSTVEDMVKAIKKAFAENLPTVTWMDKETRQKALVKLEAMRTKIGFPDFIEDPEKLANYYEKLQVSPDSSFNNNQQSMRWSAQRTYSKLHKPVDRSQWDMIPTKVNAYYSPDRNEIVFPAGILQSPFYSSKFPMYLNFGGIGTVVGHELTHGFDNNGRRYDGNGNLVNWWKNSSAIAFDKHAQCFVDQYNQYRVGDTHLDGKATLGENIADNGGMKMAYSAYKSWVYQNPSEPILPGLGLTEDQLYFVAQAQMWCSIYTPEYAAQSVLTDVHSYPKYRVIGVDANFVPFSEAFNCKKGDPMNPKQKCAIW